ncbi:uncharacterized protein AB675_6869 [Cyphellophora attinorum]|uniref:Uncharacterized protein n=1 Tax=Cyphellophora attinorum TaxID=1664694 RepID=A0A0N1HDU6_9EURO|nr:uncharacterized protein AB675_6869 [Phialophora attinorum]KPI43320.1 hypothetical protein AB675_6869 [Phialophora attinorum]
MAATSTKRQYVHFGRGGAGMTFATEGLLCICLISCDRQHDDEASRPSHVQRTAAQTSVADQQGRRFSTGVGGLGNMTSARRTSAAKQSQDATSQQNYDDDDDHKAYHDHSAPGIVLVKGGHSIGIGGFANRYIPSSAEDEEAAHNNEHFRRQSLANIAAARSRKSSQASTLVSEQGASRRGSLASLRDFVRAGGRRTSKV